MPSSIKIRQELFEIIGVQIHAHKQTDRHTDTHTHRHIHAGENNTCPKSKILGQVKTGRVRYVFYLTHKILVFIYYLAQNLWFWTGIIFTRVYVSVCVCVCLFVPRLSQRVLDRFWWHLAGWCRMIKYRFLLKMGWIGLVERIPRLFEILKLPYFSKLSGKFL